MLGTTSATPYFTAGQVVVNDVNNRMQNKQLCSCDEPQVLTVTFNYTTPKWQADGAGMRTLSWLARDWTFGGVLRYQSGVLLQSPSLPEQLPVSAGCRYAG